jgi:hypothetical protein
MEMRMANLNNALDNKLLLQYLSAAGQDISSGQPISTNVNQVTQQNIASQNFNKLLNLMLGASVTPDNPMKVSTDGNKFKFDLDMSGIEGGGLSGANLGEGNIREAIALMGAGNQTPTTQPQPQPQPQPSTRPSTPNPLASLSGADLAGLTPEMISQALQFKIGAEQMGQQEYNDYINNLYKMGMLEAQQPRPEQTFVSNVPGYGNLTLDQYKALPTEDRQYYTHVLSARQRGEEPMSRKDFDAIGDKDKHPASAEAAAIDQLYKEYKGTPPQSKIKEIHDLYNPVKEPEPKTPSPVTWTTATQELTKRFGKLDPTGMWAVTPELQAGHRLAQKILVNLKDTGYDPLKSINMAEDYSNKYYNTLNEISEESKKIKDDVSRRRYILEQTKTINKIFESQLGFNPGG